MSQVGKREQACSKSPVPQGQQVQGEEKELAREGEIPVKRKKKILSVTVLYYLQVCCVDVNLRFPLSDDSERHQQWEERSRHPRLVLVSRLSPLRRASIDA